MKGEQTMKTDIEKARDHFTDEYRILVDNFGMEKHPQKIENVLTVLELIEKEFAKEPSRIGLADLRCPNCHSWIPFDGLNGKIENAPKRCVECGQKLEWGGIKT
jgi:hypothetical protein